MAAPAPAPAFNAAAIAAGIAALQGLGIVTQADLAPLATQAQVNAQLAPLATKVQLDALQAQITQQMQAQLAAIQALLAPHNAPAIAAAAAAIVQAIVAARVQNAHDLSHVPYAIVPRADGTLPPTWPAGFSRAGLRGPIATIDALLADYNLAPGGAQAVRRDALALHIGAMRF
jgi:hypothetical protein